MTPYPGGRGTRTIQVSGGDLFRVALAEYGDALGWGRIAAANGLRDPFLTGTVTLTIPPKDKASHGGGVLGAP